VRGDKRFLRVFFEEKGIDEEETFEVASPNGTPNFMSYGVVIEAIKAAPESEQRAIVTKLRTLDFFNRPIEPFLRHLAQALAVNL
jgi:hypothetical protein